MATLFVIPDKEHDYQGYMAFVLTILWSVVTGLIVSMGLVFFPELWIRWTSFLGISAFIAVLHLWLISSGRIRTASWSLIICVWLYITIPCYTAGGISAPMIMSQMSVILSAGFLLGWRGGLAFGLLTMGADFLFAYLEVIGKLPAPSVVHTPITRWIGALIPFGTILALQYYATNHLCGSLTALQREIVRRERAPEYFQYLRNVFESGKPFTGEFCNKAKDGSLYWVDTTIVPFLDGHVHR